MMKDQLLLYYWKYSLLLFTLLYIADHKISAQQKTISGTVKDTAREALFAASVYLSDADRTLISYAITDDKGVFSLPVPEVYQNKQIWIEARHIGYFQQRKPFSHTQSAYHFVLEKDLVMLSEVVVKNRPALDRMGDTLRYIVSSFAKKEDRSIGDVLRRMPGIKVEDDGTIYHNGKKIENLYIHGDDLMSGRYGLASKIIRKEMVTSVDVIQNHQPIKVIRNKVFSDQTAINLVLKNETEIKVTGAAKAGAGLPKLYDLSANAILLNKVLKAVDNVSVNNTGIDYKNEFKKLGGANMISDISPEPNILPLSLGAVGMPDIPQKYYYQNRSGIINLNNLYNSKNGLQFKANIQGYKDENELDFSRLTENYASSSIVLFNEQQKNINKFSSLNVSFNVMTNTEKYFFNNKFAYDFNNGKDRNQIQFNNTSFQQLLLNNSHSFSNDLNWIPSLKNNNVLELRWLFSQSQYKKSLDIFDGYVSNLNGQEYRYDNVIQWLHSPFTFSDAYLSYKIPFTKITYDIRAGATTERQLLDTRLTFIDDDSTIRYAGDAGNRLWWAKNQYYISYGANIKLKRINASIQIPLMQQFILYSQKEYILNEKQKNLLVQPSIMARYNITPEQYITTQYHYKTSFGDISNVYKGAVLLNYRLLQANAGGLLQTDTHTTNIHYDYQKSINLFFFNADMSYLHNRTNHILSTMYADNMEKTVLLPYKNATRSMSIRAGLGKFLYELKINTSLSGIYNKTFTNQFANNILMPFEYDTYALNAGIIKRMSEAINITYSGMCTWSQMHTSANAAFRRNLFRINHNLTLAIVAVKNMYGDISIRHSYMHQSNSPVKYFFADAAFRYTAFKKRVDCHLQITNLFNTGRYELSSTFKNQLTVTNYNIRGRMLMLRFDYLF